MNDLGWAIANSGLDRESSRQSQVKAMTTQLNPPTLCCQITRNIIDWFMIRYSFNHVLEADFVSVIVYESDFVSLIVYESACFPLLYSLVAVYYRFNRGLDRDRGLISLVIISRCSTLLCG